MKKNKRGFTLFELLVSISIIGILTAIASVSFSSAQKKARDARRMEDMSAVAKAAESFYALSPSYVYPSNTNPWVAGTGETILSIFPRDPKGIGWTGYVYGGGTTYYACAAVENRTNGVYIDNRGITVGAGGTGPYYCVKNQQ